MELTEGDRDQLVEEHEQSHKQTLRLLENTDSAIASAQEVLSIARQRLQAATKKYEERLHGPKTYRSD